MKTLKRNVYVHVGISIVGITGQAHSPTIQFSQLNPMITRTLMQPDSKWAIPGCSEQNEAIGENELVV